MLFLTTFNGFFPKISKHSLVTHQSEHFPLPSEPTPCPTYFFASPDPRYHNSPSHSAYFVEVWWVFRTLVHLCYRGHF